MVGTLRRIENRRVGGIVKISLNEVVSEGLGWIHLALDRDQWQAFVNTDELQVQ
jgi:hypothetical protein